MKVSVIYRRRVARLAVAAAWVAVSSSGCSGSFPVLYGCTDRDEQYATTLAKLPIVAAHPDAAVLIDSSQGCDMDDGFAYAYREYRSDLAREDIVSFYRTAVTADGWTFDRENPSPVPTDGLVISAAVACFSKEIDGATAYLAVAFPSDLNVPGDPHQQAPDNTFVVDVTGSHDGAAWC
jgi:hypothetical protein